MTLAPQDLAAGLTFVESPRWRENQLWFVDILSKRVLTIDEDAGLTDIATLDGYPGGLGFMPDGTAMVVSSNDFLLLKIGRDGQLSKHADLSRYALGAANDMLIDAHGRAYVGHYGFDIIGGEEPKSASLLLVTPDGTVSEVADNLSFPNGMAITPDGKTLVVAETFAHRLTAFDIDLDGSLSNPYLWAALPDLPPDGVCLDPSGAMWVGCAQAEQFVRVEKGGHITHRIMTPSRWAVACALGGKDGNTLFCATAQTTVEQFSAGISQAFIGTVDI